MHLGLVRLGSLGTLSAPRHLGLVTLGVASTFVLGFLMLGWTRRWVNAHWVDDVGGAVCAMAPGVGDAGVDLGSRLDCTRAPGVGVVPGVGDVFYAMAPGNGFGFGGVGIATSSAPQHMGLVFCMIDRGSDLRRD